MTRLARGVILTVATMMGMEPLTNDAKAKASKPMARVRYGSALPEMPKPSWVLSETAAN